MAKDKSKAKGKAKGAASKGSASKGSTSKGSASKGDKNKAGKKKGGKAGAAKRSNVAEAASARGGRTGGAGTQSRLSGPHTWTIEELASSVPRFEESLRASGLADTTVRNYVTRSISFLAFVEQERSDEDDDV
jgi:hypothetical protein